MTDTSGTSTLQVARPTPKVPLVGWLVPPVVALKKSPRASSKGATTS
jgi:hypothetical protein